jgi:hypothetical protein
MVIENLEEIVKNNSWFENLIKAINKVIDLKKENNPSLDETKNYLAEQVFELVFYIEKKKELNSRKKSVKLLGL